MALEVCVLHAQFAKDCRYYVSLQLDDEQEFRTELSSVGTVLEFEDSVFSFRWAPAAGSSQDCSSSSRLHFAAYVLLSPTAQDAPQTTPRRHIPEAKRLGDFSLPLNYCLDRLREGKPVVEKLTLLRRPVPEEEVPVGRLTVRLRLLTPELSHSLHSVFVMARAAMNLPLRAAADTEAAGTDLPSAQVQLRVLTPAQADAAARCAGALEEARRGMSPVVKRKQARASATVLPPPCTRSLALEGRHPAWQELLVVQATPAQLEADCVLRVDVVDAGLPDWRTLGGITLPLRRAARLQPCTLSVTLPAGGTVFLSLHAEPAARGLAEAAAAAQATAQLAATGAVRPFTAPVTLAAVAADATAALPTPPDTARSAAPLTASTPRSPGARGIKGGLQRLEVQVQSARMERGFAGGAECMIAAFFLPPAAPAPKPPVSALPAARDAAGARDGGHGGSSGSGGGGGSDDGSGGGSDGEAKAAGEDESAAGRAGTARSHSGAESERNAPSAGAAAATAADSATAPLFGTVALSAADDSPDVAVAAEAVARRSLPWLHMGATPACRAAEEVAWNFPLLFDARSLPEPTALVPTTLHAEPARCLLLLLGEQEAGGDGAGGDGDGAAADGAGLQPLPRRVLARAELLLSTGAAGAAAGALTLVTDGTPLLHQASLAEPSSGRALASLRLVLRLWSAEALASVAGDPARVGPLASPPPPASPLPLRMLPGTAGRALAPWCREPVARIAAAAACAGVGGLCDFFSPLVLDTLAGKAIPPLNAPAPVQSGAAAAETGDSATAASASDAAPPAPAAAAAAAAAEEWTAALARKDATIERLLQEVERRGAAIRQCGADLVALRKRVAAVEAERDAARAEAAARAAALQAAEAQRRQEAEAAAQGGGGVDPRVRALEAEVQRERDSGRETQRRVAVLQQQVQRGEAARARLAQVEAAHVAQAAFVQKLQAECRKLPVYRSTVRMQERVIGKLEALLDSRLQRPRQPMTAAASGDGGSAAVDEEAPRSAASRAASQVTGGSGSGGGGSGGGGAAASEMALQRVRALEEQLATNATEFGDTLAKLRLRLFMIESAAAEAGVELPGAEEDDGAEGSDDGAEVDDGLLNDAESHAIMNDAMELQEALSSMSAGE